MIDTERILVLATTETDGTLAKAGLEAVSAGVGLKESLSAELDIGLVGSRVQEAADQAANSGAGRILAVEDNELGQSRYSTDVAAMEALCRKASPTLVVAVGSSRLNRVLPGVAFRLEGRIDTHICGWNAVGGDVQVTRWFYRQRMKGVLTRSARPWFLVFDPGVVSVWAGTAGSAPIEHLEVALSPETRRTEVLEVIEPPAAEQTIRPDADLLFVAGAGWTKRQADGQAHVDKAEDLILEFLRLSHASLGGSKSMVDLAGEGQKVLSFMTHMNQIGQTGATPRHPKGLSTCCHGEEPHVVGWRFVNERRAINTDPNCGWAQGKADVLYVADAFAVMSKVNELLAKE
jgi:electron transfer flavoprotein alpha subunit